jgi:hypothetical protein
MQHILPCFTVEHNLFLQGIASLLYKLQIQHMHHDYSEVEWKLNVQMQLCCNALAFFCVLFHPAESIHDMNLYHSQLLTGVAQGLVASCLEERE